MKLNLFFVFVLSALWSTGRAQTAYDLTMSTAAYTDLVGANDLAYVAVDDGYYYATNFTFRIFDRDARFNSQASPVPSNGGYLSALGYLAVYESPGYQNTIVFQLFYSSHFGRDSALTKIAAKMEGSLGNRIFKFQWKNIVYDGDTAKRANFQLWLHEADSSISYHFGPTTMTAPVPAGYLGMVVFDPTFVNLEDAYNLAGNPASPQVVEGTPTNAGLPPLNALPANGTVYTFKRHQPVGINSPAGEAPSFDLYPNPATGFVKVLSPVSQQLSIYNTTGQVIRQIDLQSGKEENIDISSWAPGIYLVAGSSGARQIFMVP